MLTFWYKQDTEAYAVVGLVQTSLAAIVSNFYHNAIIFNHYWPKRTHFRIYSMQILDVIMSWLRLCIVIPWGTWHPHDTAGLHREGKQYPMGAGHSSMQCTQEPDQHHLCSISQVSPTSIIYVQCTCTYIYTYTCTYLYTLMYMDHWFRWLWWAPLAGSLGSRGNSVMRPRLITESVQIVDWDFDQMFYIVVFRAKTAWSTENPLVPSSVQNVWEPSYNMIQYSWSIGGELKFGRLTLVRAKHQIAFHRWNRSSLLEKSWNWPTSIWLHFWWNCQTSMVTITVMKTDFMQQHCKTNQFRNR